MLYACRNVATNTACLVWTEPVVPAKLEFRGGFLDGGLERLFSDGISAPYRDYFNSYL